METIERRYTPVRFTTGPLGLVSEVDPFHMHERTVRSGDTGLLLVEGTHPFPVPEGWVLVKVDELWCPVHPGMVTAEGLADAAGER